MIVRKLLVGTIVAVGALSVAVPTFAQYRIPLPGGYRAPAQMIYPTMRGASQLGWSIGRHQSIRRYGRSGDPGPWPGMGRALGIGGR